MIDDRQNKRVHMMKLTLNSNIIDHQNVRHKIKNDEKNNDDTKNNNKSINLKKKSDI